MTTNKHFISCKEGLGLEFLCDYCMEHRKARSKEQVRVIHRIPL